MEKGWLDAETLRARLRRAAAIAHPLLSLQLVVADAVGVAMEREASAGTAAKLCQLIEGAWCTGKAVGRR